MNNKFLSIKIHKSLQYLYNAKFILIKLIIRIHNFNIILVVKMFYLILIIILFSIKKNEKCNK